MLGFYQNFSFFGLSRPNFTLLTVWKFFSCIISTELTTENHQKSTFHHKLFHFHLNLLSFSISFIFTFSFSFYRKQIPFHKLFQQFVNVKWSFSCRVHQLKTSKARKRFSILQYHTSRKVTALVSILTGKSTFLRNITTGRRYLVRQVKSRASSIFHSTNNN
jgi:hypothetical protein